MSFYVFFQVLQYKKKCGELEYSNKLKDDQLKRAVSDGLVLALGPPILSSYRPRSPGLTNLNTYDIYNLMRHQCPEFEFMLYAPKRAMNTQEGISFCYLTLNMTFTVERYDRHAPKQTRKH